MCITVLIHVILDAVAVIVVIIVINIVNVILTFEGIVIMIFGNIHANYDIIIGVIIKINIHVIIIIGFDINVQTVGGIWGGGDIVNICIWVNSCRIGDSVWVKGQDCSLKKFLQGTIMYRHGNISVSWTVLGSHGSTIDFHMVVMTEFGNTLIRAIFKASTEKC